MDHSLAADISERFDDSAAVAARLIVEALDEGVDRHFAELRRVKIISERDRAQKFFLVRARLPAEALERFRHLPANAALRVLKATDERFDCIQFADRSQRRDR